MYGDRRPAARAVRGRRRLGQGGQARAAPGPGGRRGAQSRSGARPTSEAPAVPAGYLGLGSNLGDRRARLPAAAQALPAHGVEVLASSSVYDTEPVGLVLDQPEFLNACVRIDTEVEPRSAARCLPRRSSGSSDGRRAASVMARGQSTSTCCCSGSREYASGAPAPPARRGHRSRRFVIVPLLELDPELTPAIGSAARCSAGRARAGSGGALGRVAADSPRARLTAVQFTAAAGPAPGSGYGRDAPGRRRRQHPDPLRRVRDQRDRARRTLALRDGPRVDPGRARRGTGEPAGPARAGLGRRRQPLDRLLDRASALRAVDPVSPTATSDNEMLVVGPAIRTGMPIRIDNPREVGADRLVNAVAAYDRVRAPAWWSTSEPRSPTTLCPRRASTSAGSSPRGPNLDRRPVREGREVAQGGAGRPRSLIGKSTVDAIRSGIVYGFAGQVEGSFAGCGRARPATPA